MLGILPCLLVCETKSREKVKGLINLQFIFIVSRCFKLLVIQSLFCSCLNPLSALTVTETQMTKSSDALAQNRTALSSSCSERTAQRGSKGRLNNGVKREQSQQQAGAGMDTEDIGKRLKLIRLSPSLLVPGAAQWALTLCVLYQGPDRGPLPVPCPPKDAFQDAWDDVHDPALGPQPLAMPCTVTAVGRGGCEERQTGCGRGTPFLVWGRLLTRVTLHTGVCGGLQLLVCTRTPLAGEELEHRRGKGARQKILLLLPRAFRCLFFCL